MPIYEYECGACSHTFETYQAMADKPLKRCPECRKHKLVRLIFPVRGHMAAQTLGMLAEKNTGRMSDEQKAKIMEREQLPKSELPKGMERVERKPESESPWSGAGNATRKEIRKMTEKQKQQYILTGKTS